MALTVFAVLSGVLQALGYVLYIRQSRRKEIEPNATTWLMFAYGTALLGVLEYSRDAGPELLILPAVCATFSIVVAFDCWQRGTLRWPSDWEDQGAFIADLLLTIAYVATWALAKYNGLSQEDRGYANIVFLVCSNLTTVTSFIPLIRGAARCESPVPWLVWSSAYGTLAVVTFVAEGFWTELAIYPVLNALLHGRVAWLSRNGR